MSYDPGYTKANVTYESNEVLKALAKEQKKYVYEVIDQIMREKYPSYFRKIGC